MAIRDRDEELSRNICDLLNSALARDPGAIHSLMHVRVPCNIELAYHPTIEVQRLGFRYRYGFVGALGLFNGLLPESHRVAMETDYAGRITGFRVVDARPGPGEAATAGIPERGS